jgi:hypothetical protein
VGNFFQIIYIYIAAAVALAVVDAEQQLPAPRNRVRAPLSASWSSQIVIFFDLKHDRRRTLALSALKLRL